MTRLVLTNEIGYVFVLFTEATPPEKRTSSVSFIILIDRLIHTLLTG